MAEDPIAADGVHAMPALTRYEQDTRRGRFGRDVPAPVTDDVLMADARTSMQSGAEGRFEIATYEIDPDAVAGAIVEWLLAGRTLLVHPADDR